MFQYDSENMVYVVINQKSESAFIDKRIEEKKEKDKVLPGVGLKNFTGLIKSTKIREIEPEVEIFHDQH